MDVRDVYNILTNYSKVLDCDSLYKKLENKIEKTKLDKLIFTLDSLDKEQDGKIDFTQAHTELMLSKCLGTPFGAKYAHYDNKTISRIFGGDFSKELELFAETIVEIENEKQDKLKNHYQEIPLNILKQIELTDNTKIDKITDGYKVSRDNLTQYYDLDGNFLKQEILEPNGVKEVRTSQEECFIEYGKTLCEIYPDSTMLKNVTINNGLPNQASFEILYNEDYEAINIKISNDNIFKIDNKNKELLLELINSDVDKCFGYDYDIQVNGNSIVVSIIE